MWIGEQRGAVVHPVERHPERWRVQRPEPEHFQATKHGYARGSEAQRLVDNVRNYYDILVRLESREAPLPAPREVEAAAGPPPQLSTKGTAAGK